MIFQKQLLQSERLILTAIDHEKDPEIVAQWTHDLDYQRGISTEPALPSSPFQIKKAYEALDKEIEDSGATFHFAIRTRSKESNPEERLIGFVRMHDIAWTHAAGLFMIGIGAPEDRGQGYGTEALQMALHIAFRELNLYHLAAGVTGDNTGALRFLARAGFQEEVRRRKAIHRDGCYHDFIHMSLRHQDWQARQEAANE